MEATICDQPRSGDTRAATNQRPVAPCPTLLLTLRLLSLMLLILSSGCSKSSELSTTTAANAHNSTTAKAQDKAAQDLDGKTVDPLKNPNAKCTVLLFLSVDCPIANKYAPEISRLEREYSGKGVKFWLIHANVDETPASIRTHSVEYGLTNFPVARDPQRVLVTQAKAITTPEAGVFTPSGELVYHGRIDDRFPTLGKDRIEPTQGTLREVLDAVLAGKASPHSYYPAVGCSIPDL